MRQSDGSVASTELALDMWGINSAYKGVQLSEKGDTIYINFIPLTKLQRTGGVNDLKQICSRHQICSKALPSEKMEGVRLHSCNYRKSESNYPNKVYNVQQNIPLRSHSSFQEKLIN